jgi:WD40 repeat protein
MISAVAWSPDGKRIASASGNIFFGSGFGVQVWDAVTGVHIFTYRGHRAPVSTLAWSPDGKRIASASASLEKMVQVWDVSSGATLFTYRGHTLGVNAVAWCAGYFGHPFKMLSLGRMISRSSTNHE